MKKIISLLLAATLLLNVFAMSGAALVNNASSLSSVPEGYTAITTAAELNAVRNNLSGKYILMNDIDLSAFGNWTPIGTSVEAFTGIFDGNGYAIKNMKIRYANASSQSVMSFGFFAAVMNSTVTNLTLANADINLDCPDESWMYVGGVAGLSASSVFDNCNYSGSIACNCDKDVFIGGIVGGAPSRILQITNETTISNCSNLSSINVEWQDQGGFSVGSIIGHSSIGGIVGEFESTAQISRCVNTGSIEANICNSAYIGGVAGVTSFAGITDCYNTGTIKVGSESAVCIGGIAGGSSLIRNSYNRGGISCSAENEVPVAAGMIVGTLITDESLTAETGLLNCYYLTGAYSASGSTAIGNYNTAIALSNEEMKAESSFVGFDFTNIWTISENVESPYFRENSFATKLKLNTDISVRYRGTGTVFSEGSSVLIHVSARDDGIVSVDENGNVKGEKIGTTVVSFVTASGQTGECKVTVSYTWWQQIIRILLLGFLWY